MRNFARWRVVAVGLCGALLAGGTVPARAQATGIDVIQAYEGTWKTEMEHFNTHTAMRARSLRRCTTIAGKSGEFYACHQIVNGESKALLVFTYDPKSKTYTPYPIMTDGRAAGHGKLVIDGNVWTYPSENTGNGKTTYFRVVNTFTSPNRIEYRQEYSTDKQNWTLMSKGSEAKQ